MCAGGQQSSTIRYTDRYVANMLVPGSSQVTLEAAAIKTGTCAQIGVLQLDALADNPELLQVALDQGIPLSELYGEPSTAEDDSGVISALSFPGAAAGLAQADNPDVKKADVRSR